MKKKKIKERRQGKERERWEEAFEFFFRQVLSNTLPSAWDTIIHRGLIRYQIFKGRSIVKKYRGR